jgi:hypothetical protein
MSLNLDDLLPDEISDETAYYLVEFFMHIAMRLDLLYFAQARRYRDDNMPLQPPECLQNKRNIDDSF